MKIVTFLFTIGLSILLLACTKQTLPVKEIEMNNPTDTTTYSYLALGDSYTIGESVAYNECFPTQTVAILNKTKKFEAPVIIAKTGWTTDELTTNISSKKITRTFDFVSLLIGVNNQYRGRDTANYRKEFTQLLDTAIKFARNKPSQVIVLSIPDWGITPFGLNSGRNIEQISKEIDWFNAIAKWVCDQRGISFIDITPHSRTASSHPDLIAGDGLHPSGKMYSYWAEQLASKITAKIK